MSASTSSSPSASTVISTPEITVPPKRNFAFWRPILACGGALLVGAVLVRLLPASPATIPAPPSQQGVVSAPMQLPASQLVAARFVSTAAGASGRTLTGQWKLSTDATGKATVSGEVARQVVGVGTHVEAGQNVLEISTGAESRPAPRAERQQDQAEKEQVAAANARNALAQKGPQAEIQLSAAQERVKQAQTKLTADRLLVKRLQSGEKIPLAGGEVKPTPQKSLRENPEAARLDRERKLAQSVASEARDHVTGAKSELDDAKKALTKAQKQADTATSALTKAETDFKAEKATADVLQNARADSDDAQVALKAAQTRADVALRAYDTSQDKATASENAANTARDASQKVAESPRETPTTVKTDDTGHYMTADQAAILVSDDLREFKAATRQADKIAARITDYQRQGTPTVERYESATKNLDQAQQNVVSSAPRAQFTSTVAPIAGTITWISPLARGVGAGEKVFGISQGRSSSLRFEDKSEAWKALHVGQTLNAASSPVPTTPTAVTPVTTSTTSSPNSPAMPASTALLGKKTSPLPETPAPSPIPSTPTPTFSVRITSIHQPTKEGEAAIINAVCTDSNGVVDTSARNVQMELPLDALPTTAPVSAPKNGPQTVVVPLSVILPRDGASYVAVVTPKNATTKQTTLQWRSVQIEHQTAFDVELKSGLHVGERVVAQPVLLLSDLKPEQKAGIPVIIEESD